ncbi:MAG: amidohydrolase [Chloroflexota bacterium]|nr:amidohydrolase [Chloroflexota bacterium]
MASLVLANCKIYTMDPARPRANALAFADGRVVAFDGDALAMRGARAEVIDLRGRAVIPGLVDHHIHFAAYAMSLARANLDGARSLEDAVALVATRVAAAKPGEWIIGSGWNHLDWSAPQFPTKVSLDAVAPDSPVVLDRKDGHSLWVNSAALRARSVTRDTPEPPGGVIDRDASGDPTGILRENAMELFKGKRGFDADEITADELLNAIHRAHQLGLTGIHNVEGASALRAFQSLHAQGKLTLRVTHMIPTENLEHALALGLRGGWGDEFLRIGGVKIFADGSLGSQTAWMLEPFEGSDNHGVATHSPEQIEAWARAAAGAGMMVCTHAIGDRAIREVLNVYEKLRREELNAPLRIEHAQHLHPADIPRFAALNVIASMQPIHATSDYKMADQFLGARGRYSYAFRSLLNAGARVVFGSDCPVETLDPWVGIHAAVTRERASGEPRGGWYPEEKLSVEEAVRAYLPSPLRKSSRNGNSTRIESDDVRGDLRPSPVIGGRGSDWIVLSQDVFAIPPREILSTHVEYTIIGGRIVYAA